MHRLLFTFILFASAVTSAWAGHPVLNKPTLKVLDIGNSYTDDATNMLPLITSASGSDVSKICLYKAIRSGASIKDWCNIYSDSDIGYTYTISKVMGGLNTNIETGTGAEGDGTLFRKTLTEEQWDLIVIHQKSYTSPYYNQWAGEGSDGSLDQLLSIIRHHQPEAEIGFYLIHSYWDDYAGNLEHSSLERWKLIAESVKRLTEDYGISFIIPYGTAVENLRSSSLNNEYDLTRDGAHCGMGLCRYTAACCYYETLIAPRSGISVVGNTARFTAPNNASNYPDRDVTDENAPIAHQAALLAVKHPYECMNPEITTNVDHRTIDHHESHGTPIYNTMGQRVNSLKPHAHGVYVIKNRKIMR